MTRKCWAVVTFGLGVALAPLVHQLGSACLYPAAAVAQEQLEPHVLLPAVESKSPPQNTDGTPRRAANGKVDEFSPGLEPDGFNKRNDGKEKPRAPQNNSPFQPNDGSEIETATNAEVFLELAKQKAALLSPEEMTREVESLRKELTELRATVQLREAVEKLKQLVSEHPNTKAAQRATRMLETETLWNRRNNHLDEFTPNLEPSQTTSHRKI